MIRGMMLGRGGLLRQRASLLVTAPRAAYGLPAAAVGPRYFSDISAIEKRRKMLLWRAKSRGWLELDVLMGTFTQKHIGEFDDEKLDSLEEILELENPDLIKWFTGQAPVPEEIIDNEIMKMMMEYVKSDHQNELGYHGKNARAGI
eukprot:TRINITY_DN2203_c0_g1_i1.p2 TRINITY_DN2203_c0_g1~~TRINITY_DN2203_c0_g1_i1.p2  ORF type:complete len:146 (-),score=44.41 TRINITY_DN2203_c0_g1_i1:312-749(-)